MKYLSNSVFKFILLVVIGISLASCSDSDEGIYDMQKELSIHEKVTLLEKGRWLLKGFEDNVMYSFNKGERRTHYSIDGVFTEPIPARDKYSVIDNRLSINFGHGHIGIYDLNFYCENSIVEFSVDQKVVMVLLKEGTNYVSCLE